jgi:hypothetical protein
METINEQIANIKILKSYDDDNHTKVSHNLYRLGDIYLYSERFGEELLQSGYFKNTFGYLYAQGVQKKIQKFKNVNLAADIILKLSKKNTIIPKLDKNTLVIHMRLGDVINLFLTKYADQVVGKVPNLKKILYEIQEIQKQSKSITKILIITAFHFGKHPFKHGETEDSTAFLKYFISRIPSRFRVEIKSSTDPDIDLMYLSFAQHLILSCDSGFGILAKDINMCLKTRRHSKT